MLYMFEQLKKKKIMVKPDYEKAGVGFSHWKKYLTMWFPPRKLVLFGQAKQLKYAHRGSSKIIELKVHF